jgi:rubrerythrin
VKRILSSFNLQVVHHARNLLAAEGIRAVVRNEILSSAMGELPPAECQTELWVLDERDAGRAERILNEPAGAPGAAWRCTACGETSEPQFTQCWKCGAERASR